MIKRLNISNFKNLLNVSALDCDRINALIGPNGSGKSSFLQAIDFLRAFFLTSVEVYLQEREWDYRDLPNLREAHKRIGWDVEAELPPGTNGRGAGWYRYRVALSPRRYLGVGEERLEYRESPTAPGIILLKREGRSVRWLNRKTGDDEEFMEVGLPASIMSRLEPRRDHDRHPELLRFRDWVESFRGFLLWDPKVLRMPDRGKHDTLGPSGEHLAPLLAKLKREKPEAFVKLVNRVKRLFPTVSDISVMGGRTWGWQTLRLHEANGQAVVFNSQQMSDGVLRLLAVTSLLYLERIPSVITFEEPENGVHPQLIREVVQVLKELTLRKPPNQCQVFFTTHSPYVLDEFFDHPEQVFLVERGKPLEGAKITRLSQRPHLKIIRDAFEHSLGEAWVNGLLGATAGAKP
jgi:predicted ATPase